MQSSTNILNIHPSSSIKAVLWQPTWPVSYFLSCFKHSTVHQRKTVLSLLRVNAAQIIDDVRKICSCLQASTAFHCTYAKSRKHSRDGKQPSEYGILITSNDFWYSVAAKWEDRSVLDSSFSVCSNIRICFCVPSPQLHSDQPAASVGQRCDGRTSSCPS